MSTTPSPFDTPLQRRHRAFSNGARSTLRWTVTSIDAGARDALDKAIAQIIERLHDAPTSTPFDVVEIQQMAEDTRAELQSPKPKCVEAWGSRRWDRSAIAYAPHLKEAYDTLKWATYLVNPSNGVM